MQTKPIKTNMSDQDVVKFNKFIKSHAEYKDKLVNFIEEVDVLINEQEDYLSCIVKSLEAFGSDENLQKHFTKTKEKLEADIANMITAKNKHTKNLEGVIATAETFKKLVHVVEEDGETTITYDLDKMEYIISVLDLLFPDGE